MFIIIGQFCFFTSVYISIPYDLPRLLTDSLGPQVFFYIFTVYVSMCHSL